MALLDDDACAKLFAMGTSGAGGNFQPGEFFEHVIAEIYTYILGPGDIAIDGGAHVGRHTFPMAERVGGGGLVLAVEALPDLARKLARKAQRGKLGQVQVVARALFDRITRIPFHRVKVHSAYSGIEPRRYDFEDKILVVEVETTTIDAILLPGGHGSQQRWRFCKLDLEGGELRALQGGRTALNAYRPLIIFENDQELSARYYRYSKEEWFGFFGSIGYDVFTLWGRRYQPDDWGRRDIPWYFIAVAAGSKDSAFVSEELPGLLRNCLQWSGST